MLKKSDNGLILAEYEQRARDFVLEVRRLLETDEFMKAGCRECAFTKLEDAMDPQAVIEMMPELRALAEQIGIDKLKALAALEYVAVHPTSDIA